MGTRYPYEERESLSPSCSIILVDCFSPRKPVEETASTSSRTGMDSHSHENVSDEYAGVERDMSVM